MDVRFDFDIDDLDSMVKNEAMAVAKERARGMRCKRHGQAPDLKLKGAQIVVDACCQKFADEVSSAISD